MALSDLSSHDYARAARAERNIRKACEAWIESDRAMFYEHLALAGLCIDAVLAVIEDPKDKPRNKSPNGPLRASEKR